MKYILPRVIYGNLGDLASRWGVLRALDQLGAMDVTVFRNLAGDIPPLEYCALDYRPLHNLRLDRPAWDALYHADTVWMIFQFYRILGLKVNCLFQGQAQSICGATRQEFSHDGFIPPCISI